MLRKLEEELIRMKQVEEVEHTIKRAPEGTLRCSTSRGYYQYYKGKKYLDKNNITVTIRTKRGRKIGGACGQLGKLN